MPLVVLVPDSKSLLRAALPFVRLLEIFSSCFLSALRVVAGTDGVVVLVHRTIALASDIENVS